MLVTALAALWILSGAVAWLTVEPEPLISKTEDYLFWLPFFILIAPVYWGLRLFVRI